MFVREVGEGAASQPIGEQRGATPVVDRSVVRDHGGRQQRVRHCCPLVGSRVAQTVAPLGELRRHLRHQLVAARHAPLDRLKRTDTLQRTHTPGYTSISSDAGAFHREAALRVKER